MIYTFTLNPSIDYIMNVENFKIGEINRSSAEIVKVGGKGINVSRALKKAGSESIICGFAAGNIGQFIRSEINKTGILCSILEVKGNSRINVKITGERETAVNGSGCQAELKDIDKLCDSINCSDRDYIVLSGSLCKGIDNSAYSYIMDKLKGKFIVDTAGEALRLAIKKRPFVIKPNNYELGELFKCDINTYNEALYYGKKACEMGSQNVIVSMGSMGAVFVNEKEEYILRTEKIKAGNTVGAGDYMLAGFLHRYIETGNFKEAMEFGRIMSQRLLCENTEEDLLC